MPVNSVWEFSITCKLKDTIIILKTKWQKTETTVSKSPGETYFILHFFDF